MNSVLNKYKIIWLIVPFFLILIYIIVKIVYFPLTDFKLFVDYYIYKTSFEYYPIEIYDYHFFLYAPQFFLEFFWINILSFESGLIFWFVIKVIIITICWRVYLYNADYNQSEVVGFIIFVLGVGLINETFVANADVILLGCGFGSFLILDKAEKMLNRVNNHEESSSKINYIIILNLIAGFVLALGMFKILILIYLPILIYKSNSKIVFLSAFFLWLMISNYTFFLYPEQLIQFIDKIKRGQTLMSQVSYYKEPLLNAIWRTGFAPLRTQIYVYPTVVCYINIFIQKPKSKGKLIISYIIGYFVFQLIGGILFILGF
ncbi:MAG: hypothetical protein HWN81_14480 [Candidatus Lokiarchaeota archaeon]|nr:hypothetical protein [Candidatus Lokiarchaeota archaeon]